MKRRQSPRRRSKWGAKRKINAVYMEAWEAEIIVRDMHTLAVRGMDVVSADTLDREFPGAYNPRKLTKTLDRLHQQHRIERVGRSGWNRRRVRWNYRLYHPPQAKRRAA